MKNFKDLGAIFIQLYNKLCQWSYSYQGFTDTLKMYCKNVVWAVEKNHLVGFCVAKLARKKEGRAIVLVETLGVVQ